MKNQISEDIKVAMKAREQKKVTVLRGLMSEIKRIEIDTRAEVNDEKIKDIIQKEIKKRRDTIKFAIEGGRQEMVEENEWEISVISGYLGKQLSDEELSALITKLSKEGADSMGKIMGALNKDYKGQFDGRRASELAKTALGS